MEGGVPLEEEAEAETIVDPLTGYTIEDVQMVLGQLTGEMLSGIQVFLERWRWHSFAAKHNKGSCDFKKVSYCIEFCGLQSIGS